MNKSVYASKLDEIEKILEPFFERRCFIHRKRGFIKQQDEKLLQLVEFGMAQSHSMYYGKFTVDISIFIPEVYDALYVNKLPKKVTSTHCEIVKRLPSFQDGVSDMWWDTTQIHDSASEISSLMLKFGFPFLEKLSNRESIINEWKLGGDSLGLSPRGGLVMAIIYHKIGRMNEANQLITSEITNSNNAPGYSKFVSSVATKIGIMTGGQQSLPADARTSRG